VVVAQEAEDVRDQRPGRAGSQERKLRGLVGLLERATPLEARYLIRTVTGNLRLGIRAATIMDALAEARAGGRKVRPVLERAYNICSTSGLVAAIVVEGGLVGRAQLSAKLAVDAPVVTVLAVIPSIPRSVRHAP
jgi:DNA ligase 1